MAPRLVLISRLIIPFPKLCVFALSYVKLHYYFVDYKFVSRNITKYRAYTRHVDNLNHAVKYSPLRPNVKFGENLSATVKVIIGACAIELTESRAPRSPTPNF